MKSNICRLNNEIAQAKEEEANTDALALNLRQHLNQLHTAIAISSSSPDTALIGFVSDYVDSLPEHLLAFHALADEAGVSDYVDTFLNLAFRYFTDPPEILTAYSGLQGVFYKAYMCQRILEEVNDLVMSLSGAALAPMDMSMANIICHDLIGDKLANQLDHLVLLSVETANADKTVFDQEKVKEFMSHRKFNGWQEVIERWPCFTKEHSIDLQLSDR